MQLTKKYARSFYIAALSGLFGSYAAASVNIYGGATFAGGTGGSGGYNSQGLQTLPGVTVVSIGGVGTEVAHGSLFYANGGGSPTTDGGTNSFTFTSASVTPLGAIGTLANGHPRSTDSYAINSSGMVSGYIPNPSFSVITAARWDVSGTPTALTALGTATNGNSSSFAYSLSDAGVAAGSSAVYGGVAGNTSLGGRPVLWAANSTTPNALGIYDTGNGNFGSTTSYNSGAVYSINSSGTMVGLDEKYVSSGGAGTGNDIGGFASVWTAAGAITQLADLPGNGTYAGLAAGDNIVANSVYSSVARVINNAGIVSGTISKFDNSQATAAGGGSQGIRPVRWNSNNNTVQLLNAVGTTTTAGVTGYTTGSVNGMNGNGDVAGALNNYDGSGVFMGTRPELWKASGGTAITALGLLGTSDGTASGTSTGAANGVNDGLWSVGNVSDFTAALGGDSFGTASGTTVAALWDPSGNVTDLNTLITTVPSNSSLAGWVMLTNAFGITNDGWISGVGTYDPGGGLPNYSRAFLIQDTTAVPEPASFALVAAGVSLLGLRRRRKAGKSLEL